MSRSTSLESFAIVAWSGREKEYISEWRKHVTEDIPLLGHWLGVRMSWGVVASRARTSLLRDLRHVLSPPAKEHWRRQRTYSGMRGEWTGLFLGLLMLVSLSKKMIISLGQRQWQVARQVGVDKRSLLIVNLFVDLCPIYLPLSWLNSYRILY